MNSAIVKSKTTFATFKNSRPRRKCAKYTTRDDSSVDPMKSGGDRTDSVSTLRTVVSTDLDEALETIERHRSNPSLATAIATLRFSLEEAKTIVAAATRPLPTLRSASQQRSLRGKNPPTRRQPKQSGKDQDIEFLEAL